jgi:hypothetical protein
VEADDGVPDNLKAKSAAFIDIVLVESDTIWTLDIPGTCVEVAEEESKPKKSEDEVRFKVPRLFWIAVHFIEVIIVQLAN